MKRLITFLAIAAIFIGCKVNYGFSGASIDYTKVRTYSVAFFPNYAPLAQPTLSQEFTEALRDIFLNQTKLELVKDNGDLRFSGKITDYRTTPVGIQADESAAQNRLTITVSVKFENMVDDSKNFEQKFTKYQQYDATQALSDVESQLIEEINQLLVQDIFNKAVSDW